MAAAESTRPSVTRVVVASFIGTTIEWYDFFLYGTAAALVFNQLFFPTFDPLAGTMAALATYSVGFFARPVGGVVFGHFGDRLGRKSMLVMTLMMMGMTMGGGMGGAGGFGASGLGMPGMGGMGMGSSGGFGLDFSTFLMPVMMSLMEQLQAQSYQLQPDYPKGLPIEGHLPAVVYQFLFGRIEHESSEGVSRPFFSFMKFGHRRSPEDRFDSR